ncbi:MAG: hypothetical protein Alpg2KO_22350 [Alphaproteobacteria bacterium]
MMCGAILREHSSKGIDMIGIKNRTAGILCACCIFITAFGTAIAGEFTAKNRSGDVADKPMIRETGNSVVIDLQQLVESGSSVTIGHSDGEPLKVELQQAGSEEADADASDQAAPVAPPAQAPASPTPAQDLANTIEDIGAR